jgi:hypoxanthine-DNA glycosylase
VALVLAAAQLLDVTSAPTLRGLAPILPASARLLILGSMPGAESLRLQQYYAHPRNAFWPIICDWLGVAPSSSYSDRCQALASAGVALWDVLASCSRAGSLDSAIDLATAQPNDFAKLFAAHPDLNKVCCNGATAYRLFVRQVLPTLPTTPQCVQLPSTSPANAAVAVSEKLERWRLGLGA